MACGSYADFLLKRGNIFPRHAFHGETIEAQQNEHQPPAALQQRRHFAETLSPRGLKPLQREGVTRVGKRGLKANGTKTYVKNVIY